MNHVALLLENGIRFIIALINQKIKYFCKKLSKSVHTLPATLQKKHRGNSAVPFSYVWYGTVPYLQTISQGMLKILATFRMVSM